MNDYKTYIAVTSTMPGASYDQGSPVEFNNTILQSNIDFTSPNFTINDDGLYLVNWRLSAEDGSPPGTQPVVPVFTLSLVRRGIQLLSSGKETSEIAGLIILAQSSVVCLNAGDIVSLINLSNFTINVQQVGSIIASMSLVKIA